jgi:hypothetical protein
MHFSRTSGEPLVQNVPYLFLPQTWRGVLQPRCSALQLGALHEGRAAVPPLLQAKERYPVGSGDWAEVTAKAFEMPKLEECAEVVKPETVVERRGAQGAFGEGFARRRTMCQPTSCGPWCCVGG